MGGFLTDTNVVLILVTFPADSDISEIVTRLVNERVAACITVFPEVESVYRWGDEVQCAKERQLLVKTTGDQVRCLKKRINALHPYDTPEFLVLSVVAGDERYLNWVGKSTGY